MLAELSKASSKPATMGPVSDGRARTDLVYMSRPNQVLAPGRTNFSTEPQKIFAGICLSNEKDTVMKMT